MVKTLFETSRLLVREWGCDDLNDMFEFLTSDIFQHIDWRRLETLDQAAEIIGGWQQRYKNPKYTNKMIDSYCKSQKVPYAIVLKKEDKAIGTVGIRWEDSGIVEIGYILNSDYQGNGYATEAVIGMIGFLKPKAKSITAATYKKNIASWKVMEKAGMKIVKYDSAESSVMYEYKG